MLRLVARIFIYSSGIAHEVIKINIFNSDHIQGLDKEQFMKKTFSHLSLLSQLVTINCLLDLFMWESKWALPGSVQAPNLISPIQNFIQGF